jgi:hypothetical protein
MDDAKLPTRRTMIYLACPYSHEETQVRKDRARTASAVMAGLLKQGYLVFNPLEHSVRMAEAYEIRDPDMWMDIDKRILSVCDSMIVICLDGWQESKGVVEEVELARKLGLPISYCDIKDSEGYIH